MYISLKGRYFFIQLVLVLIFNQTVLALGNNQRGDEDWAWGSGSGNNPQIAQQQQKGPQSWPSSSPPSGHGNKGWAGQPGGSAPAQTWPTQSKDSDDGDSWQSWEQPQQNMKGSAYPDGAPGAGGSGEGNLQALLKGVPGEDFPDFSVVPETGFNCKDQPSIGYYSDVEAGCQVFHICQAEGRKDSFLCPIGTIFNQKYFVCDWWFNVNCSDTPSYYELNVEVYKEKPAEKVPIAPQVTTVAPPKAWPPSVPPPVVGTGAGGKKSPIIPPQVKPPSPGRGSVKGGGYSSWSQSSSNSQAAAWSQANTWRRSEMKNEAASTWTAGSVAGQGGFKSNKRVNKLQATGNKPVNVQQNQKWTGPVSTGPRQQSRVLQPVQTNGNRNTYGHHQAPFGARMRPLQPAPATTVSPGMWTPSSAAGLEPTTLRRGLPNPGQNYGGNVQEWYDGQNRQGTRISTLATSIKPTGIRGVWEQESVNHNTPWVGDRDDYSYDYVNTLPSRINEYESGNEWTLPTDANFDYYDGESNRLWTPLHENEIPSHGTEQHGVATEAGRISTENPGKGDSNPNAENDRSFEKGFEHYESKFLRAIAETEPKNSSERTQKAASNSLPSIASPSRTWGQRKQRKGKPVVWT